MHDDHAVQVHVVVEVIGAEVKLRCNAASMDQGTRPILAEQGALMALLAGIVQCKTHPVTGSEQKRRSRATVKELRFEHFLRGGVGQAGFNLPTWVLNVACQRRYQLVGA
ncbi:hypothetical protein D3C84_771990 [compost metagenome]